MTAESAELHSSSGRGRMAKHKLRVSVKYHTEVVETGKIQYRNTEPAGTKSDTFSSCHSLSSVTK